MIKFCVKFIVGIQRDFGNSKKRKKIHHHQEVLKHIFCTDSPLFYFERVMPRFSNKSKNRKSAITRRLINKKKVLPTTTISETEYSTFYTGPLDLTYISDEICVAGYPWNRRTEKRIRRNNIDEMASYLNETYGDRYLIWNLSGTREYDTVPFENRVLNFPCGFVDFGTPTIDQLYRISYSLRWWIKSHPKHVRFFFFLLSYDITQQQQQQQLLKTGCRDTRKRRYGSCWCSRCLLFDLFWNM